MNTFSGYSADAQSFFEEHGYVVFTGQLSLSRCALLSSALDILLDRFAQEQRLSLQEYVALISQWRDLWRRDEAYRQVLAEGPMAALAAHLMQRKGARLLHDHVIAKPKGNSGTVPWHQDYPYWPVDTAGGLSCWCPLEDVDEHGGCLDVVDGSHLWGECPPVDFLADNHAELNEHPALVRLPVRAGSMVVLHCLTWHRTGPNLSAGQRRAYITLWLPPNARYAREHADWHPTNEHITVAPGEILNDDWFPHFGEVDHEPTAPRLQPAPTARPAGHSQGLSMFSASQVIADQLRGILRLAGYLGSLRGGIGALLASEQARQAVLGSCLQAGIIDVAATEDLAGVLVRLVQCSEAYRLHRARNVYNDVYAQWWQMAGARWAQREGMDRLP